MIALEVIAAVVLLGVAAATTWMALVGLMGVGGFVRLRRCRSCGHLVIVPLGQARVCPYCRHPRLASHISPLRLHHLLPDELEPVGSSRHFDAEM